MPLRPLAGVMLAGLLLSGCAEQSMPTASAPAPAGDTAPELQPEPPPPSPAPITSPQWGGTLSRNMVSEETGLPSSFTLGERDSTGAWRTPPVNMKWSADLGTQTYGTPTVAEGRVMVGTNNGKPRNLKLQGDRLVLMCFDEEDGEFLWQLATPSPVFHGDFSICGELGVCTSAAIEEDRAYVVTSRCHVIATTLDPLGEGLDPIYDEQAQYLAAPPRERFSIGPDGPVIDRTPGTPVTLSPTDANIVWVYDIMTDAGSWPHDAMSSSALLIDDYLYVGTGNAEAVDEVTKPWPEGPSLILLDKRTGEYIARDRSGIVSRVHSGQWSSPSSGVVDGRRLIFYGGGDGFCYAFDAEPTPGADGEPGTLEEVWRCDANTPEMRAHRYLNRKGPNEIIGTPAFHEGRVYVTIGQDPAHGLGNGALTCIDATGTGDISESGVLWRYTNINRSLSTVSVADGLVYVADLPGTL
ncbi:MAG: PQQ-binding-like beta-propeller repeat protein, partial [Armatimonadia bacterium]|nr:PQQ-binding-like beta-propeller repeat protein [Armatimonadia bacterium]